MVDRMKKAASNVGDAGGMGDLKKYVEGINFPATKEEVITALQRNGAKDLIEKLRELGQNRLGDQNDLISSFMDKRQPTSSNALCTHPSRTSGKGALVRGDTESASHLYDGCIRSSMVLISTRLRAAPLASRGRL